MKRFLIMALSLSALALVSSTPRLVGSQSLTDEAPAGFDNRANGFVNPARFNRVQDVFERRVTIADGLGPVYNAQSCAECHANPVVGGSSQVNTLYAGMFDGTSFTDHPGGSLINDRAINPRIQESVFDNDNVRTFRTSLNTLGDGFVECIADETLMAIANNQPAGMRGDFMMVPVLEAGGAMRLGRFGWKDQDASLVTAAARAHLFELGITSPLFPEEQTSNGNSVSAFDQVPDPEATMREPTQLATFIRATKAPPRNQQLANTPDALAGAQLFQSIGCAVCHVSSITTAPAGTLINGGTFTVPPELGDKVIHPFSDFLLHDIGTGDGIEQMNWPTSRNKMRTPPLWGLRTRTRLMHDGESLTRNDAINRHHGEAQAVWNTFQALTPTQKNQLLQFLASL